MPFKTGSTRLRRVVFGVPPKTWFPLFSHHKVRAGRVETRDACAPPSNGIVPAQGIFSSSAAVHGCVREAVSARTCFTISGVMTPA